MSEVYDNNSRAAYEMDRALDARVSRMSADWRGAYKSAGRGVGQYAIVSNAVLASPGRSSNALGSVARLTLSIFSLLALAGFGFGLLDAYNHHDTAALAGEKAYFYVNDFIFNGFHDLSVKVFSSADLLGFMDAVSGATGFCLASLLAKSASFGAAAFDIVGQIFH